MVRQRPNYDVWLNQVVAEYQSRLDRKDRMFARFLLDLPSVPSDVFTLLRDLCTEPDRYARLSLTDLSLSVYDLCVLGCRLVSKPYATSLRSGQRSAGKL